VVTGPVPLTGIAARATCGDGMTLRTGKSGRHPYHACAAAMQKGRDAWPGRSVPMDRLDAAVMETVGDQLLAPELVGAILRGLMERHVQKNVD